MTTKTITTYVPNGYVLSANYSELDITATGGVGGFGVSSVQYATISNAGRITGNGKQAVLFANGGVALNGSTGFIGGAIGVHCYGSVSVTNLGTIRATTAIIGTFGGDVVNGDYADLGALISGSISLRAGPGSVTNFATITGTVQVAGVSTVTNGGPGDTTALIDGGRGVELMGVSGTIGLVGAIMNFGTIEAYGRPGYFGAHLYGVGSVVNGGPTDSVARIEGATGVGIYGAATVTNFGVIAGTGAALGAAGVSIANGGIVANGTEIDRSALIEGYSGIVVNGAVGTIANFGTVQGLGVGGSGRYGVVLYAGGAVTNGSGTDRSALIEGARGVTTFGDAATVKNFGTIRGVSSYSGGVYLGSGGSVTNGSLNNASALIEGGIGVILAPTGTMINFGTVRGLANYYGSGAYLSSGDTLTNGAAGHTGALIEGFNGVTVTGAATTVTNFGTIRGAAGTAVSFASSTDILIVEADCAFKGAVLGGGGTLDLDTGVGTLTGLLAGGNVTVSGSMAATTFQNFATVVIGAAANFNTSGAVTLAAGQTVNDAGVLTLGSSITTVVNGGLIETSGSGGLTIKGPLQNTGTIAANGGSFTVKGAVSGAGSATIGGGVLDLLSTFTENVTFTGSAGMLELAQSQTYTGTVTGFSKSGGTFLDLLDITFGAGTKATYAGAKKSGVLTVTDGTHTAQINLKGDYRTSTFIVASDGHGGTIIHDPARFIAAMAGLGAGGGWLTPTSAETWRGVHSALAAPQMHTA